MAKPRSPFVVAFLSGTAAAVVFLIAFISFLSSHPDAQNGIALFLSPFFATWIGFSVWMIVLGCQSFVRPESDGGLEALFFAMTFWLGIVGLILIAVFLAGEYYQAIHATIAL